MRGDPSFLLLAMSPVAPDAPRKSSRAVSFTGTPRKLAKSFESLLAQLPKGELFLVTSVNVKPGLLSEGDDVLPHKVETCKELCEAVEDAAIKQMTLPALGDTFSTYDPTYVVYNHFISRSLVDAAMPVAINMNDHTRVIHSIEPYDEEANADWIDRGYTEYGSWCLHRQAEA